MTARDFAPIAETFRRSVADFYAARGESLDGAPGQATLETNSGFVERRAAPLVEIIRRGTGRASIEGLRLVDLGCGFGALSAYFAASGAIVTGVDPIEARLDVGRSVASEHGLPIDFRVGRMEKLDLDDESFELAVQSNSSCYIVEHEKRRAAFSETLRVLVPGGFLVIRNPNRWNPRDQFTGLPLIQLLPPPAAARAAKALGRKRSAVRVTSPWEGLRELRRAGFTRVADVASPASRRPGFVKPFARFHHLTGWRPS